MALAQMATVPGLTATELNYPQHVTLDDDAAIAEARRLGLDVTALNMRYDAALFRDGAFASPEEPVRAAAVDLTAAAVDLARRHGIDHVIVWPGQDGVDIPFQAAYAQQWAFLVEGLRTVARRAPEVRVSVEYKPSDPRRVALVATMAEALLCAADVGEPNVGVTLDLCHALMAGEVPAKSAELALARGKLFGLHLNDGYGLADDGLPAGSVHPPQLRELLWSLERHGWRGTVYFDTFPAGIDAAAEAALNIATVERELAHVARLRSSTDLLAAQAAQDPALVARALAATEPGEAP